jgi:hypothetical protein
MFVFLNVGLVYAEDPDSLQIIVSPSSFEVNESVDLTIKAIKSN